MDDSSRHQTLAAIQQLKRNPRHEQRGFPFFKFGRKLAWLEPVTRWDLDQEDAIALLSQWRPFGKIPWPIGIRRGARHLGWLASHVMEVADKLLFWVKGLDGTPIGTVGLSHLDLATRPVAIDNVVRARPKSCREYCIPACKRLLGWTFQTLA